MNHAGTSPARRRIAVLSTGRQDWGILRTLCDLLRKERSFELVLLLGGMHLSARFGRTRDLVVAEGFSPAEELEWIREENVASPETQAGEALAQVGAALRRQKPEALIIVGDRFETAAAALAATMARVPIVHLHGGEETAGAIDNVLRHAMTKLSHLHFTSHPHHTARVIALGEDAATVHTVGAPGLDNLRRTDLPGREELEARLSLRLEPPVVIVTHHPATLGGEPAAEAREVAAALDAVPATYVITLPNADEGGGWIREIMLAAARRPGRVAVEALGERNFWGLLRLADAMVGNSSSALIEAPVVGLPAVNIGDRQSGRVRGGNIIDCPAESSAIAAALLRAMSPEFRTQARQALSPFGNGGASEKIISVLRGWTAPNPPRKTEVHVK